MYWASTASCAWLAARAAPGVADAAPAGSAEEPDGPSPFAFLG